jgi:hypothetical protein
MPRATHLLIATAAVTAGLTLHDAHAQQKPGDVLDPTIGHITPAGTAPLFIHSHQLRVRNGAVRVSVECPPLAGRCHGVLELSSLVPRAELGKVAVDLDGAERRTVRIKVKKRDRTVPGRVVYRAGEPLTTKLVVVHGG